MKKDQPKKHDVVYIDSASGKQYFTKGTQTSKETMDIEGVTYQVFRMEVTADTHPVYTGKRRIIDTEGRADRFNKVQAAAASRNKDA